MKKIKLASGSPRRKELLEKTGLSFEIVKNDYKEDMTLEMPPTELVKYLSCGKAKSVNCTDGSLIISADTIVVHNNEILGKPHTEERAIEMLKQLNNTTHQVMTGMTILDSQSNEIISHTEITEVVFRKMTDEEIQKYGKSGLPLDKAGAYGIQDQAAFFIKEIRGDYYNVMGLPLCALSQLLKQFDINIF